MDKTIEIEKLFLMIGQREVEKFLMQEQINFLSAKLRAVTQERDEAFTQLRADHGEPA